jgi:hypothetical protein
MIWQYFGKTIETEITRNARHKFRNRLILCQETLNQKTRFSSPGIDSTRSRIIHKKERENTKAERMRAVFSTT